ncbi:dopamine D2-like receptor [Hippoglossus hippoglossus]|uniref:dopamine D2-like receptor n=1 Tax=Hippoglossus hippoglossus TaxID=8267 RepID=UPI00148D030F|nr:dopamine D2-like receptor [Hippoglossus hippoglossus]
MRAKPAPARDFGNNTIWEEYIDITFVVANSLVLLMTSVVGIAANIFVILAVYHQRSLQTSNNALVVNLAIIDILRCVMDCPFLLTIIVAVHQYGHVDEMLCDAQVASFSFCCCIQLLTLACISAERYQAIAQPFKIRQRGKRIKVLIPLTWTLSILVSVFCFIFIKDSPVHVRCKGLQREMLASYDTFGLYMLFPLWAACFGLIIGFYAGIFAIVRSHNRKVFDKGTFPLPKKEKTEDKQKTEETTIVENGKSEQKQTSPPATQVDPVTTAEVCSSKKDSSTAPLTPIKPAQCVSGSEKELKNTVEITDLETEQPRPPAKQVAVRLQTEEKPFKTEQSNPCATRVEAKPSNTSATGSVKSSTAEPQKVSSKFNTEDQTKEKVNTDKAPTEMTGTSPRVPCSEDPESVAVLQIKPKQGEDRSGELTPAVTVDQVSSLPPVSGNAPETEAPKDNLEVEGAVCMMPSKASKERANKKKESKMAKRAGYIIITFLLFWLPLITTILVNFVVHKNKNTPKNIMQDVEILSVSLSCVTSLTDPIIYAAVNPQFRTEFDRIRNKVKSALTFEWHQNK